MWETDGGRALREMSPEVRRRTMAGASRIGHENWTRHRLMKRDHLSEQEIDRILGDGYLLIAPSAVRSFTVSALKDTGRCVIFMRGPFEVNISRFCHPKVNPWTL